MDITPYTIPAMVALVGKAGIYLYARYSRLRNYETKLYLFLLFALSVQGLAEIGLLTTAHQRLASPPGGTVYFASSIAAISLFVHLAWLLAFGDDRNGRRIRLAMFYGPAVMLEVLLFATPLLVSGFIPFHDYSYTKIAGPWYFLFELYAMGYLVSAVALLLYGSQQHIVPARRMKNSTMLLGSTPAVAIVVLVVSLQHFGVFIFNTTVVLPLAITFLLGVTAYATHQYRLFDIEFYIPWSKVRQRKTAFYNRIRAMIAEIADLDSVDTAVSRLAETLRCPVALVGGHRPAVALAGATNFRVDIPDGVLRRLDHIVVRNEIAQAMPEIHAVMKRHGLAAIVPFHPRSRYASGWLLLGDSFSDQVYTRLDFKVVEELFDKMADLFIDKLVAMRAQLTDAFRQIRTLEQRQVEMRHELALLRNANTELVKTNGWLHERQPADALAVSSAAHAVASGVTLTLLGRDKALLKTLRRTFPQLVQYARATSRGFRRQPRPDVLIAHLAGDDPAEANALARFLAGTDGKMAVLLYGPGAAGFIEEHKRDLLGRLVEALPDDADEAVWVRRIEAVSELGKALHGVPDHDHPLLGKSQVFREQMRQAERLARLLDALVIRTTDFEQAVALAAYIHEAGGNKGGLRVLRDTEAPSTNDGGADDGATDEFIPALVASVRQGTLMIADVGALTEAFLGRLLQALHKAGDVRVIAGCFASSNCEANRLLAPFRPFVLEMPSLRERKQDLALLVHYFTLQFNLQTGGHRYITQAVLDELTASQYPDTLLTLKRQVFELLSQGAPAVTPAMAKPAELPSTGQEKTLDQHVADFEAQIIGETLKRCGGNKSKAARLLGLRPNTLHYKLERYGLMGERGG